MGALYHLKQKLVDFCNVIQENVSRTDTVPSSKVVYDLKADSNSQISDLSDSLTNATSYSLSVPSGWSTDNIRCLKVGKTVYISGMLVATSGQTSRVMPFPDILPQDIMLRTRMPFIAFDNAKDTAIHGIFQGRTLTFYRQETTSLTQIEFSITYLLN